MNNKTTINQPYDDIVKNIKNKNKYSDEPGRHRHTLNRVPGRYNLNEATRYNEPTNYNRDLLFVVDTIRDSNSVESRELITPVNRTPPMPPGPMPPAPIPSALTTPSSLGSVDNMFESYPIYTGHSTCPVDNYQSTGLVQDNVNGSVSNSRFPNIKYASYDGAKVVYSRHNSVASSHISTPIVSYPNNLSTENNQHDPHHSFPLPGEAPYFNPARISNESTKATIGLNGSNENIWAVSRANA